MSTSSKYQSEPQDRVKNFLVKEGRSSFQIMLLRFCLFEILQDSYPPDAGGMGVGTLSSVPTTLNRWTEEAKVLDGDSIHDCMAGM